MGDKEQKNAAGAVPKFGSFKPKPLPPLKEESPKTSNRGGPARRENHRHVKETESSHISQTIFPVPGASHANRHHRQSNGGNGFETSAPTLGTRPDPHRPDKRTGTFAIDKLGDTQNLVFGALHRFAIPQYNRSGYGHVLGFQNARIDRARSTEKGLILSTGQYASGEKRQKALLSLAAKSRLRKLRIPSARAENTQSGATADYVSIRPPRSGHGTSGEQQDSARSSPDDFKQDIPMSKNRAISFEPHADGDLAYGSEDSASDYEGGRYSETEPQAQKTRDELSRAVDQDPSNVDAWLKLIEYQDHVRGIGQNKPGVTNITRAEWQSNAEVKVSMYESALLKAVTKEAKEKLALGLVDEGSKIWDSGMLSARWQSLLRTIPDSLKLWTHYLDFRQTAFSHFRYEDTRASFLECLVLLRNAQADPSITTAEQDSLSVIKVYIVVRLTSFMREVGFSELSVATWQALLEYEIYRPTEDTGRERVLGGGAMDLGLSRFENFWESEVPRIGEDGATGWANFTVELGGPFKTTVAESSSPEPDSDIFGSWATIENRISLNARQPARTIDDLEENDPYQVILFSDIRDVLENFAISPVKRSILVAGWLVFCQLPPWTNDGNETVSRVWYRDPFLRSEALSQKGRFIDPSDPHSPGHIMMQGGGNHGSGFCGPEGVDRVLRVSPVDQELCSDTLFSSKSDWFYAFDSISHEYAEDCGPVETTIVRRTLSAIVQAGVGNDSLAEYFLALELRLSPDTVRKTAKKLIRSRPESLRLYNAYALIEYRLLNEAGAQGVLVGAINNSRKLQGQLQDDALLLWRTWTWELLNAGRVKDALERLLAYPDPIISDRSAHESDVSMDLTVQPPVFLRVQQALKASRDHFLSLVRPIHSFISCDLLIILAYLSTSASLPSALTAFSASLATLGTRFPSTSLAHELLHQSFARLLYHHATHVPLFKPATVRESLAASISLFPHNTILLAVYAWNESRFRIDDRVRTIIKDVVLRSSMDNRRKEGRDSVIPHLFSLHTELNRSPMSGFNTYAIRNTFERAVKDPAGAHCAGLWKMYVMFELTRGERKTARTVWWRGVHSCPWVKALWMMGFQELRDEMKGEELKELYEMMVEKELRLHVDLNELLDKNRSSL